MTDKGNCLIRRNLLRPISALGFDGKLQRIRRRWLLPSILNSPTDHFFKILIASNVIRLNRGILTKNTWTKQLPNPESFIDQIGLAEPMEVAPTTSVGKSLPCLQLQPWPRLKCHVISCTWLWCKNAKQGHYGLILTETVVVTLGEDSVQRKIDNIIPQPGQQKANAVMIETFDCSFKGAAKVGTSSGLSFQSTNKIRRKVLSTGNERRDGHCHQVCLTSKHAVLMS